ncbi:MAG: RHS repeat-associated core domain-containing protein [Flavobacteriaceae bacterium]|nr:RHS repeat-associated core domain-containing protein [Flavobacteriaceae bacterium]
MTHFKYNIILVFTLLISALNNVNSQELHWQDNVDFHVNGNQLRTDNTTNNAYVLSIEKGIHDQTNSIELTNFIKFPNTIVSPNEFSPTIPIIDTKFNVKIKLILGEHSDLYPHLNDVTLEFTWDPVIAQQYSSQEVVNLYRGDHGTPGEAIGSGYSSSVSSSDVIKIVKDEAHVFRIYYNDAIVSGVDTGEEDWWAALNDIRDYRVEISSDTPNFQFNYTATGFEDLLDNSDACLPVIGNKNWTSDCTYDIEGNLIGSNVTYYNELGKVTQNQRLDIKTGKIWASELQYDYAGRPAFQTFDAKSTNENHYAYINKLIKKPDNTKYDHEEWLNVPMPTETGSEEGSVGWYYSNLNSSESYQDVTEYPFIRTVYDQLNPGKVLKVYGGNKQHYTDVSGQVQHHWKNRFSHTMPAAQELYYAFGKDHFQEITNGLIQNIKVFEDQTSGEYISAYVKEIDIVNCTDIGTHIIRFKGHFLPVKDKIYLFEDNKYYKIGVTPAVWGENPNAVPFPSIIAEGELCNVMQDYEALLSLSNDSTTKIISQRVIKSVSIDLQDNEVVSFSDLEGKVLASARSGGSDQYEIVSLIGTQGFVDIHIPLGCENTLTFIGNSSNYKVFDLREGTEIIDFSTIKAGFFRIEIINNNTYPNLTYIDETTGVIKSVFNESLGVRYKVNYYDYTLNYYTKAGNLIKTIQPLGFDAHNFDLTVGVPNHTMESTFEQNSLGQVLKTTSPDEGTAEFKYRKDGQIRFSQNSIQVVLGQFSYTNYDTKARPIESGVCIGDFTILNGDTSVVDPLNCSEQTTTLYDVVDFDFNVMLSANYIDAYYGQPQFIAGNVVKTATKNPETSKTWYSYDIYGRLTWVIQDITGLGVKTIDYEYDDVTSQVTKVYYQKHSPSDRFVHRYTYNHVGEMVKVETSVDDAAFTEQAAYSYYEKGALKRVVLAEGIQGIDYVYNLNGSLKSINHPSLDPAKDPGHDANDAFGITLDYYQDDYLRSNTNISTSTAGEDRLDGNIKATHWATKDLTIPGTTHSYYYTYNKNKWLEGADFKYDSSTATSSGVVSDYENRNQLVTASEDVQAAIRVTLSEGFHAIATPTLTFKTSITGSTSTPGATDFDVTGITYDANGNILTLNRNKNTDGGTNVMDQFSYDYTDGTNQLDHVADAVSNSGVTTDLETQALNNYDYNSIGQLTKNNDEDVIYVYNTSGLVTNIRNTTGTNSIDFVYNDKGQRMQKIYTVIGGTTITNTTYYVRDVSGNTLAVYTSDNIGSPTPTPQEYPIYGASRVGVYHKQTNSESYQLTDHLGNVRAVITKDPMVTGVPVVYQNDFSDNMSLFIPVGAATTLSLIGEQLKVAITDTDKGTQAAFNLIGNNTYKFEYDLQRSNDFAGDFTCEVSGTSGIIQTHPEAYSGSKVFFFTPTTSDDYTFSFMLRNTDTTVPEQYFTLDNVHITNVTTDVAEVSNYTDYYPFGMAMPQRKLTNGTYRYAFQGQELDPETGKEAFQLRLWDGRIGRWLTTDPYGQYHSPYLGMGNDPINGIDPDGGYRTWIGAAFGWIGGGFQGSIRNPGLGGNENYAVYKGSFQNDGQGSFGSFVYQNDYGSDLNWAQEHLYFDASAGVDFGLQAGGNFKAFGAKFAANYKKDVNPLVKIGFKYDKGPSFTAVPNGPNSTYRKNEVNEWNLSGLAGVGQSFTHSRGFWLPNGDVKSEVSNLVIITIVENYHTSGVHKGKVKSRKFGWGFGADVSALLGFNYNVGVGLQFDTKYK